MKTLESNVIPPVDFTILNDRKTFGEKTQKWRENKVNYLVGKSTNPDTRDWREMYENYKLHNDEIDQTWFREFCDPLNLDEQEGKNYVQVFNLSHTTIDRLVGEEDGRPWTYQIYNMNPASMAEINAEKTQELHEMVKFRLYAMVETAKMRMTGGNQVDETQLQQINQEVAQFFHPEEILAKYRDYRSAQERKLWYLMKYETMRLKLKHKKTQSLFHMIVAGVPAVKVLDKGGKPDIEVVNPLGLTWHKSPEVEFIQDGDYVIHRKKMSLSDIINTFVLDEDVIKKLENYQLEGVRQENVFGHMLRMPNETGYLGAGQIHSTWLNEGQHGTGPATESLYDVYYVYWRSQSRRGLLSFIDEAGIPQSTIVSDDFEIPVQAAKQKMKDGTVIYNWVQHGLPFSLEWTWLPEIWEGVRIGADIYPYIRPFPYQDMNNPKLPIFGLTMNNTNARGLSVMSRLKPWQKLYFMVMTQWLKLIGQDQGIIVLLNTLLVDPKIGIDKTMQYARDMKIIPYNPLQNIEDATKMGAITGLNKPAEVLNLANSQQLVHYTGILRFIEDHMDMAAGIPGERKGMSMPNTNASDNARDVLQSMLITGPLYTLHDLLWEDVLRYLLHIAQGSYSSGEGKALRWIMETGESILLDIAPGEFDDFQMGLTVTNSEAAYRDLQVLKTNAHAIIQNEKRALSTLTHLMTAESLTEFKKYVEAIESNVLALEQAQAEQLNATNIEIQKMRSLDTDKEIQRDLTVADTQAKAQVLSSLIGAQNSGDQDEIPQYLELLKTEAGIDDIYSKIKERENKQTQETNKAALAERKETRQTQDKVEERRLKEKTIPIQQQKKAKKASK